jgi:hypothetical protein
MKHPRALIVAAATGALLLLGAAPASAAGATIDPGDSLYAINCDADAYNDWQLMSVAPETAVSTPIGSGAGSVSDEFYACAAQPAYNQADGKSYYIQHEYEFGDEGARSYLATIDVATGVSTRIAAFNYWDGETQYFPMVTALAIDKDGTAWTISEDDGDPFSLLDLETGELTLLGDGLCCTWALAIHPVTGDLYGIDDDNQVFIVSKADGDFDHLADVVLPEGNTIYSLQIDESGRFWVEVDQPMVEAPAEAHLWSFTLDTAETPVHSGIFDDDPYYTAALLLIPGVPALANTGATVGGLPAVAGLLMLLGTAVVVTAAIRRRSAAA